MLLGLTAVLFNIHSTPFPKSQPNLPSLVIPITCILTHSASTYHPNHKTHKSRAWHIRSTQQKSVDPANEWIQLINISYSNFSKYQRETLAIQNDPMEQKCTSLVRNRGDSHNSTFSPLPLHHFSSESIGDLKKFLLYAACQYLASPYLEGGKMWERCCTIWNCLINTYASLLIILPTI